MSPTTTQQEEQQEGETHRMRWRISPRAFVRGKLLTTIVIIVVIVLVVVLYLFACLLACFFVCVLCVSMATLCLTFVYICCCVCYPSQLFLCADFPDVLLFLITDHLEELKRHHLTLTCSDQANLEP